MLDNDEFWMRRALELAERGRGWVEPNPLVGAVVVRDGVVVAEGWHERFGGPHAEVNALHAAGDSSRGATLYVTLEPCCHHGKTPPCTDAILGSGIKRVVAATIDPNPQVAGEGLSALRSAGLDVDVGVCKSEATWLNAPYLTLQRLGRPYVHAKWAMTLDGKIAAASGDSKWISGRPARDFVHVLRGRMDGIMVGAGTVRADDPLLTARPSGPRTPLRIVVSRSGNLPPDCQLLRTASDCPVLVTTLSGQGNSVRSAHCEVLNLAADVDFAAQLLAELGRRRMTNVLVEGGAELFGSLCDAKLIDEVHVFVAPTIIGGVGAKSPVSGVGIARVADSWPLAKWEHRQIGDDVYLHGWMCDPSSDEPA